MGLLVDEDNMKKTVGFLITDFNGKGGTERVTAMVADGLEKHGYGVYIISCKNGMTPCYLKNEKINILSLCGEQTNNKAIRKWKSFTQLKRYVMQYHIDVMVAVDVPLYAYLYPLQLENRCKCIAWEHFNFYAASGWFQKSIRKFAAQKADELVVLGQHDLENYKQNIGKNIKAQCIYNPVAMDASCDYKGCDTKRILAAGRLEKQKGFDRLVEVWNKLENKFPEWTLDILGDGSQKKEIEDKIKEYKLKNIHLKGYSSDIKSEYDSASIYALTSRYEGFVLVLIEAQARRLPCICFDIKEGPCEIIEDGVNGFLVEDGNIEQFADKLGRLMESRDLRKHFSDMAQKDLSRFENSNVINQWDKLLKELEQGD